VTFHSTPGGLGSKEQLLRTSTQAIFCGLLVVVLAAFSPYEKPSVFVTTDPEALGEQTKGKAKELSDSAEDVRKEIEKRRDIVPAADAESADILVTILDRRIEVAQLRQNYSGGHIQNYYQSRYLILYRTSVGDASHNSEYFMDGSLVTWKRVASGLSKQVERWARENLEAISRSRELKQ
jgi:hypothetical protein